MKKGFTLAELLIIIAIIAVLAIFIVPNILDTFNSSKNKLSTVQKNQIESATEMYISDFCINPIGNVICGFETDIDDDGHIIVIGGSITLGTLITEGYLSSKEIENNCGTNGIISVDSNGNINLDEITCNFEKE